MLLTTVISGGQTGADQAALYAAREVGLKTGGTMPKGFRTLRGNMPEMAAQFGMMEDKSPDYPPRTRLNVKNSDATIRIAERFDTAGERLTLRYITELKKPRLDIRATLHKDMTKAGATYFSLSIGDYYIPKLIEFLQTNDIQVLNIAGNSEKSSPGIFDASYDFLLKVFRHVRT